MRFFKSLTLALVLLTGLTFTAHASTIAVPPFSIADFVIGSVDIIETFEVPEDGTYKASIEDFLTLTPFEGLVFAITQSSDIVGAVNGAGGSAMFSFMGTEGVLYQAHIVGALPSETDIGGFGAEVSQIPIPPSLLLLGSGLVGLVVFRRRRS